MWWIAPFLFRLSIAPVSHQHFSLVAVAVTQRVLLDDIHHVLNRAVVHSMLRTPVPAGNFGGGEGPSSDRHIQTVFALNVVGGPAKVTGRHVPRVPDHHQLKQQNAASENRSGVSHTTYSKWKLTGKHSSPPPHKYKKSAATASRPAPSVARSRSLFPPPPIDRAAFETPLTREQTPYATASAGLRSNYKAAGASFAAG